MRIYFPKILKIILPCLFAVLMINSVSGQNMFRKMMDFDGDGKADFAVTRNIDGTKYWYLWQTTDGFRVVPFGISTDENAPGEFDGDGKFDPAVYRNALVSGNSRRYDFWILGSQYGVRDYGWTTNNYPNTVAHQQDYDGDGKTDVAYTFGTGGDPNTSNRTRFFIVYSGPGVSLNTTSPGGTLIKLGDMTGDGKADVAGFNSTTHVVSIKDTATSAVQTMQFGLAGDEFVPADFDGDGKGDLTVFRPSNGQWWWMRSSDNVIAATTFGTSGDVAVPADYDGDGKTDVAIWRAGAQSQYWVYGSTVGVFVFDWGISTDTVVHY